MAQITINEISQNYTYNIGTNSFATVAMPITAMWGPAYVGIDSIADEEIEDGGSKYDIALERTSWTHFSATQAGLESFVATYRGPASNYKLAKDYSYQMAMTLLTSGYDVLACRVCPGAYASYTHRIAGDPMEGEGTGIINRSSLTITAKYPGTFGNNLEVSLSKVGVGSKFRYWNLITYVVDSSGIKTAVENLIFVFDPSNSTDSIPHIDEVESDFLTFSTSITSDEVEFNFTESGFVADLTGGTDLLTEQDANSAWVEAWKLAKIRYTSEYDGDGDTRIGVGYEEDDCDYLSLFNVDENTDSTASGAEIKLDNGATVTPSGDTTVTSSDGTYTTSGDTTITTTGDIIVNTSGNITLGTDYSIILSGATTITTSDGSSYSTSGATIQANTDITIENITGTAVASNGTSNYTVSGNLNITATKGSIEITLGTFTYTATNPVTIEVGTSYSIGGTVPSKTRANTQMNREWIYNAAFAVYNLLQDKLNYNPQRIISSGWDDQDICTLTDSSDAVKITKISPLHYMIMETAYYSRCATGMIDIPKSEKRACVYNTDTDNNAGYAQKLARIGDSLEASSDVNKTLYTTHSALFAPWGSYKYVGTGKQYTASPSFLALMIQRAQILNQSLQYEWALPTNRKHNLSIGKMDYKVPKKLLDVWQKLEGVGVNVITTIPDLGLNLWGNSTLYEVPPATYQALANLSTRYLVNAVEDVAYRCGLAITFQYNNEQAYNTFYAGVTPTLDTMKNVGAIDDYYVKMAADIDGLDQVNANSVVGKIYLVINGVINDITIDLIALPPGTDLNQYRS